MKLISCTKVASYNSSTGMSLLCVPCVPWHTRFSEDPILKTGSMCANMEAFNTIGTHGLNFIKTSMPPLKTYLKSSSFLWTEGIISFFLILIGTWQISSFASHLLLDRWSQRSILVHWIDEFIHMINRSSENCLLCKHLQKNTVSSINTIKKWTQSTSQVH